MRVDGQSFSWISGGYESVLPASADTRLHRGRLLLVVPEPIIHTDHERVQAPVVVLSDGHIFRDRKSVVEGVPAGPADRRLHRGRLLLVVPEPIIHTDHERV